MPGSRVRVVLFTVSRVAERTVRPVVLIAGRLRSGSAIFGWPVKGAGVTTSGPCAKPPTRLATALPLNTRVAAFPFVPIAPPSAAGHAELLWSEPSKITVGPPENITDGHPRLPLCHVELYGLSSTTENLLPGAPPSMAVPSADT